MPDAAAFLFYLSPGSRAVSEPEPDTSHFLEPYLKITEATFSVCTEGMFGANALRLWAVRFIRPLQAHRRSEQPPPAGPVLMWLGLHAQKFKVALHCVCCLVAFSLVRSTGICGASRNSLATHPATINQFHHHYALRTQGGISISANS